MKAYRGPSTVILQTQIDPLRFSQFSEIELFEGLMTWLNRSGWLAVGRDLPAPIDRLAAALRNLAVWGCRETQVFSEIFHTRSFKHATSAAEAVFSQTMQAFEQAWIHCRPEINWREAICQLLLLSDSRPHRHRGALMQAAWEPGLEFTAQIGLANLPRLGNAVLFFPGKHYTLFSEDDWVGRPSSAPAAPAQQLWVASMPTAAERKVTDSLLWGLPYGKVWSYVEAEPALGRFTGRGCWLFLLEHHCISVVVRSLFSRLALSDPAYDHLPHTSIWMRQTGLPLTKLSTLSELSLYTNEDPLGLRQEG